MDASIMQTVPSNDDSMVLAVPEPAAAAMSNLRILYQLSAALGTSFDVEHVLDIVMDLCFEHVKADRGIIFLFDEKRAELTPTVARIREETTHSKDQQSAAKGTTVPVDSEKIHASRTIINHVIDAGEGVLSSNAMADKRFSAGKSVHAMSIRSALCVPIKARKLDGKGGDEVLG